MAKGYVIYNPLAGNGDAEDDAKLLQTVFDEDLEYYDMTRITNYAAFLSSMEKDDYLVIVGGDGTLNRFVNDTNGIVLPQEILYLPSGSGNDFARELKETLNKSSAADQRIFCSSRAVLKMGNTQSMSPFLTPSSETKSRAVSSCRFNQSFLGTNGNPVVITQYLKNLPSVEVQGKTYRFLNGVGFGIDGYCCQVGDELKKIPDRKVNYTGIAIKGLLFHFSARNAKVTVDGKEYAYKTVWIAPTMYGKYYGGGMIPTPEQDRSSDRLSVMLFHGAGRLHTLCVFPSIFKGTHVKHTNMVAVHTGHEITVEFDRPTPLQIDGETILDVTKYTARAAVCNMNKVKEKAVC